ncbi:MAG: MFS transporter [Candidatus Thorarchaeota archaeon]
MVHISIPFDDLDARIEEKLKKNTMRVSIYEGSFGVFSSTLIENSIIPFSLSINSSPFQIGLMSSLGNLVAPIGQIIGSQKIEKKSRKSILILGTTGQMCIWPFFITIALFYYFILFQSILSWILIIFFLIYMLFAGIMNPSWVSVMGDVVPADYRGRYFSKRNLINQLIAITGTILLFFLLDWYNINSAIYFGFILIFVLGFLTRSISVFLFTKHYYPPFKFESKDHVKVNHFFKEIPKSNFGKFTLFVCLLTFGQWIAKPFFSVYMLTQLQFNYAIFMLINLSSTLIGLFTFPLLGKFSDRFGNVRLIQLGALIIPFLPFFWMIYTTPLQIFFGIQILSGFGWTAFNLATANFIYDNTTSKTRGKYIALYSSLIGLAIIGGGFLGSISVSFIPINFMNSYHFIFLLSGIIRLTAVIFLLQKIKEVRVVSKPILNAKNLSVYKWLYDLMLRRKNFKKK